jgi:TolA-binding protein
MASSGAPAAEGGELDASPALFSVLAALNAAGYDAELDSPANHPLRQAVRRELASRNIPSLAELKRFVEEHRQSDPMAEVGQYVSFALVVDGPPNFSFRLKQNELPPDVLALEGLAPLMARFHREAGIDELWRKAQPAFDEVIARYHEPVTRAVTEVNAYLRHVGSSRLGGRFQIYVDLLGAPHQIHSRSYGNEYFIVLTPSPEPQVEDVRHAYLHYVIDPVVLRHAEKLEAKKALLDYALGAPALEEHYKKDFILLATECLIKAVEARLMRAPASSKQAAVEKALREGFILTPFFAEQLAVYEKQEQSLRFYFAEMIQALDPAKEERRLDKVEFASERPTRKARAAPAVQAPGPSGPRKTAEEAEQLYRERRLTEAREAFLRVLRETDDRGLRAEAFYGLARIATLENDPETAEQLFQRTLELSPEGPVRAWAHVYLGRLADLAGEREEADRHYREALATEGVSPAARQAAEQGLQGSFRKERK